jgi:hypothetical protein
MPVNLRNKKSRRARVSATLASWTGSMAGTAAAASTHLGRIDGLVYDWTGSFTGTFQASAQRSGVITTTLSNWTASITGTENYPAQWTDALGNSFNIPQGQAFSYTYIATDVDGDAISFVDIDGNPIETSPYLPTGITATPQAQVGNSRSLVVAGNASVGTGAHQVNVDLASQTTAEADWLYRTQTGPYADGVVWAHNFEHQNEVLNFLQAPNTGNDPTQDWAATHHALDTWYEAGTGFAGGGCLVVQTPAADVAFERSFGQDNPESYSTGGWYGLLRSAFGVDKPGIPFGRGFWRRPFAALNGNGDRRRGNGTGLPDINNAGKPTYDWRPWKTEAASEQAARRMCADFKGGLYTHGDYTPPPGWVRDGNEFYIQYRWKIPNNRFHSERMIPAYTGAPGARFFTNATPYRARQAASKYHWIANLTNGQRPQELVVSGNARMVVADGAPYEYTGFTNFLIFYNGVNHYQYRSGVPEESWLVPYSLSSPDGIWVTFLHRVRWGHAYTSDNLHEWWASVNGSPYVTLGSVSNANWAMDAPGNGTYPLGGNCFEPTHYNNYTDNADTPAEFASVRDPSAHLGAGLPATCGDTYQTRYTQIIFSTQYIPPPGAGA